MFPGRMDNRSTASRSMACCRYAGKPLLFGWFDLKTGKSAIWIKKGGLHMFESSNHRLRSSKLLSGMIQRQTIFVTEPWPEMETRTLLKASWMLDDFAIFVFIVVVPFWAPTKQLVERRARKELRTSRWLMKVSICFVIRKQPQQLAMSLQPLQPFGADQLCTPLAPLGIMTIMTQIHRKGEHLTAIVTTWVMIQRYQGMDIHWQIDQ